MGTIRAELGGIAELRADLEAVSRGLGRDLRDVLREAGGPVEAKARQLTPFGPGPQGGRDNLPHIRDTYALVPVARGINLVSDHPAAPVHEFGGTIAPRATPITIAASQMAYRAGQAQQSSVERRAEQGIDALLRRHRL
jgi:hypothetical protein